MIFRDIEKMSCWWGTSYSETHSYDTKPHRGESRGELDGLDSAKMMELELQQPVHVLDLWSGENGPRTSRGISDRVRRYVSDTTNCSLVRYTHTWVISRGLLSQISECHSSSDWPLFDDRANSSAASSSAIRDDRRESRGTDFKTVGSWIFPSEDHKRQAVNKKTKRKLIFCSVSVSNLEYL